MPALREKQRIFGDGQLRGYTTFSFSPDRAGRIAKNLHEERIVPFLARQADHAAGA